jgi:para-nitrobenzyl esterase
VRLATDLGFWRNALRQSQMLHKLASSTVYMYECAWKIPCHQGFWAPHGIDIPLIFNVESYGVAWDGKDSDAQRRAADPHARWKGLSRQMIAAWTQFARTGDPSSRQLKWPAFDPIGRATMLFDSDSLVVHDLRGEVREAIEAA